MWTSRMRDQQRRVRHLDALTASALYRILYAVPHTVREGVLNSTYCLYLCYESVHSVQSTRQ